MLPLSASSRSRLGFWLIAALIVACWIYSLPAFGRARLDLQYYLVAAHRIAHGGSAYGSDDGYIYPPLLAHALALLPFSVPAIAWLWNTLLAASLLVTVWLGMRAAGLSRYALGASALLFLFFQPAQYGISVGNASLLVAGLLALAASCLFTLPILAGALVGLAAALKIIPVVILVWMAGAYVRQRDRVWLLAGSAGVVVFLAGFLTRDALTFLHAADVAIDSRALLGANFSLFCQIERVSGIRLAGMVGLSLAAALAFLLGFQTPPGERAARSGWGIAQLIAVASAPVAWSHLFVLAFWPALLAAGSLVEDPLRRTDPERWRLRALQLVMAFLVLARIKLFFLPDNFVTSVIFPIWPFLALTLVGTRLLHTMRSEAPQPMRAVESYNAL
jgi:hypothetical protein